MLETPYLKNKQTNKQTKPQNLFKVRLRQQGFFRYIGRNPNTKIAQLRELPTIRTELS